MTMRNDYKRTISHVKTGLTKGTTSTYTTTATSECSIDGKWATGLSAQTNTATPTTDARTSAAFVAQTDNTACAYVFGITAAGAIAVCQGPVEATETGSGTTHSRAVHGPNCWHGARRSKRARKSAPGHARKRRDRGGNNPC